MSEEQKVPSKRYAVVGNPNSGKTTLFNALTGLRQKVGNYPGVTVEKKSGQYKQLIKSYFIGIKHLQFLVCNENNSLL